MASADLMQRFPQAAWIDPTARIWGEVSIGAGASVWPYAVIRCESNHVRIGRLTNLQDHVMSVRSICGARFQWVSMSQTPDRP